MVKTLMVISVLFAAGCHKDAPAKTRRDGDTGWRRAERLYPPETERERESREEFNRINSGGKR